MDVFFGLIQRTGSNRLVCVSAVFAAPGGSNQKGEISIPWAWHRTMCRKSTKINQLKIERQLDK